MLTGGTDVTSQAQFGTLFYRLARVYTSASSMTHSIQGVLSLRASGWYWLDG